MFIASTGKVCLVQVRLDMFSASKCKVCFVQIRFRDVKCK